MVRLGVALLALASGFASSGVRAQDATVEASVDRTEIRINESFSYVIRALGDTRGAPDLSPLTPQFEILSGPAQVTRVQAVGGARFQQSSQWTYELMAKQVGKLTLPAVRVGNHTTNAITLEVRPAPTSAESGAADYFIELEAAPENPYVQAQTILTVRLFVGVQADRSTLSLPVVSGGTALIETLRDDVRFTTSRAGRGYTVHERRFAIFPEQAGTLTVGQVSFEAVVTPSPSRTARIARYTSGTVPLDVRPPVAPPAAHAGAAWLPARSVTIKETWSGDLEHLTVGVPLTRTIVVEADGLLETQLPELDVPAQPGVRQYAEQPELEREQSRDGLRARRSVRYAVIAQTPGEVEIAGVELPWWNVTAERWEVATLAPQKAVVAAAANGAGAALPPLEPVVTPAAQTSTAEPAPAVWFYVSLVLALGWAATLGLWWRSNAAHAAHAARASVAASPDADARGNAAGAPAHKALAARAKSERRALRALRAACAADDGPGARAALLDWAELRFSDAPRSLGALAPNVPDAAARAILDLEAHLYGAIATPWRGEALGAAIAALDSETRSAPRTAKDPFLPLYR